MSPNELFPQLRKFAATKTIVGFDIVELNPFYDNKGQQTARLVRRIMLQFLTGIAMKKKGMDPKHIHPRVKGEPQRRLLSTMCSNERSLQLIARGS